MHIFHRYDADPGVDTASRKQLPLMLAYAHTIHKTQSLTLNNMEVFCTGIFAPGQLAVAIGRARNISGLRVVNFQSTRHVIPQHRDVAQFSTRSGALVQKDMSCCKAASYLPQLPVAVDGPLGVHEPNLVKPIYSIHEEDADGPDDEEMIDILTSLQNDNSSESDNDLDIDSLETTKATKDLNPSAILDAVSLDDGVKVAFSNSPYLPEFVNCISVKCDEFWKGTTSAAFTMFFSKWHSFSHKHLPILAKEMFPSDEIQYPSVVKLAVQVRDQFVAAQKPVQATYDNEFQCKITKENHGNIRFLSGRGVALTKKNLLRYCLDNAKNIERKKIKESIQKAENKLKHLDFMRTTKTEVLNGAYPWSAEEVERKQNLSGGLTHVTDRTFEFYLDLEKERQKLHNFSNLQEHKSYIFLMSTKALHRLPELQEKFRLVFEDMENVDNECIEAIYSDLVDSYLRVANNEFRNYLKTKLNKKKKLSHRAEILRSSSSRSATSTTVKPKVIPELKRDSKMSQAASVKVADVDPVADSASTSDVDPVADSASTSDVIDIPQSSSASSKKGAGIKGSVKCGKGKKGGKGKRKKQIFTCPGCDLVYPGGQDWIGCDVCPNWWCRICVKLENDEEWANQQNMDWICPQCQQ
jgi:hypothetical protein